MEETQADLAGAVALAPVAWQAAWLSVGFLLDVTTLSRGDGDLLQPLLLTAILEANQAELHKDPALQRRYGDETSALPDALRRPISINATAQSLGLPFETVRRRVRGLVDAGLCVSTTGGLYVPQAAVTSAAYTRLQAARTERLGRFHGDLLQAGVLSAGSKSRLPVGSARAMDRSLAEYMLRASHPIMRLAGGAMNGLVLVALWATTTEDLGGADWSAVPASYGAVARPRAATDLAERLRMPRETVRRHLLALQAGGLARRSRSRWMAEAAASRENELREIAAANLINLRRLFARLDAVAAADETRSAASCGV